MLGRKSLRSIGLAASILFSTHTLALAGDQDGIIVDPDSLRTRTTLTDDWFGRGDAMRAAGLDVRLEWSQFYQGLTAGRGDKNWEYGGKWDILAKLDLAKLGLWRGLSVTAQGNFNYGESVNGTGGSLIGENAALYFPGIEGPDASDVMALYLQQNFGDNFSLLVGKLNLVEFARATPLRGGGGVDAFWNINLATPITGDSPPTINGAQLRINTQPVSYSITVFDAEDATNRPLFSDLFANGVNVMGTATYKTSLAGMTGYYGVKGIYSTRKGPDLSELIPSAINNVLINKTGSYFVELSMQQYLVQDPSNPARGWGVFAEVGKADGNPNTLQWTTYAGIGGSSLIPGRPDDRFGIAYFHYGASEALKEELSPIFNLTDESGVEAFYNVAVTPWLRITADIQFIRPASADFPDDTYAGVSTYVKF